MTTATDKPASTPKQDLAEEDCSTRKVLTKIEGEVTEAKLEQEIASQKVSALEEHLKQLEEYDKKITAAADAYGKGIDAVCKGFDDLRETVEQNKSSYECLVEKDKKEKVSDVLTHLQGRRETLKTCKWNLKNAILDKTCELEQKKLEVGKADKQLNDMLALLDHHSKELAALKELNETIGCSDTFSNECRYAFYLDLEERLDIECWSLHDYTCKLVDQVKALDGAREEVRTLDRQTHVLKDQLDRVTKLYDDLVANWRDELCRAVTAGSVSPLPGGIEKVCATSAQPANGTRTPAGGATEANDQQQEGSKQSKEEYEANQQARAPQSQKD